MMIEALASGGLSLVGGWLGAYLGAYLKKKGENLATHEDIDKIVDQMRAVTAATKEIESKIDGKVWDRQRRWELKRDVLFDINKSITEMVNTLTLFNAIIEIDNTTKGEHRWEKRAEASRKFKDAVICFNELAFRADLVCGGEMVRQLYKFGIFMSEVADKVCDGKPEAFKEALAQMMLQRNGIKVASRRELGFEDKEA
jgi:hypothetical protein